MLRTKEEITNYLVNSGMADDYVCGDGTFCDMFSRRVIPSQVFSQTSIGSDLPGRNWWIEYLPVENKFILRCSYFDVEGNPITRDEFIQFLKSKLSDEKINRIPAVLYTSEAVIEWVSTGVGEWTATYTVSTPTSGCMIVGALSKIFHKSVAPIPSQPSVGTCWALINPDTTLSNTINWTDVNGVFHSEQGIVGNSVIYVCSTTQPYESPVGNVVISSCNSPCSNICESLICDICEC